MKIKLWSKYLLAYLLWALLLALGFWFGLIGQNAFQAFLGSLTAQNQGFLFIKQMIFLDKVFSVIIWLVWLIMMVVSEESLRRSVETGGLFRRFARLAGPLLLLIFLSDAYLLSVTGFTTAGWLHWLLLVIELGFGTGLLLYGRPYRRVKSSPGTNRGI